MAKEVKKSNTKTLGMVALIFTLMIFSWLLFEVIIKGFNVVQHSYGINPATFFEVLIGAEIFFDLGIALIIIGSGVIKFSLRSMFKFDMAHVNFENKTVYFGFSINRVAALIPPGYLLVYGWGKTPWFIILLIFIEVALTAYITSIPINIHVRHKSSLKSD